jgi:hypothetical protein
MSSNAAFAVRIPIEELARNLGRHENQPEPGFEILKAASGEPLRVRVLEDAVLVLTTVPIRGIEPEELGALLRNELGVALDANGDPRGVLAFPDSIQPKAKCWADLVEELDGLADWVPLAEPLGELPPGFEAVAAQVMGALGPDLGALQQKLLSGDPAALADVSRRMQDLLASPAGAGILQAMQNVDLGAMLGQPDADEGDDELDDEDDGDDVEKK